jgi:hypothetical protein
VLARQLRAELHHLRGIVDGDHLAGALGHQLREGSLPRPEVRDHYRRHELQERFGDAFPRAPRHVLAAELAGQFVEIAPHFVLPLAHRQAQRLEVLAGLGDFAGRFVEEAHEVRGRFETVESVLAGPPAGHQAGLFQLRQVGRDAALPLGQDLLHLGHRQLFLLEQQEQPEPARVRRQPQGF